MLSKVSEIHIEVVAVAAPSVEKAKSETASFILAHAGLFVQRQSRIELSMKGYAIFSDVQCRSIRTTTTIVKANTA